MAQRKNRRLMNWLGPIGATPRIIKILMHRDSVTEDEAWGAFKEARERVQKGEDPEEILEEEFGLEPDYVDELL